MSNHAEEDEQLDLHFSLISGIGKEGETQTDT